MTESSKEGFVFPFLSERKHPSGCIFYSTEADHIRQSLMLLLTIRKGERILSPAFGNRLYQFTFAPNTETLRAQVRSHLEDMIRDQEPRALEVKAEVLPVEQAPTKLKVSISYKVSKDAMASFLTFDLDLQEGSYES